MTIEELATFANLHFRVRKPPEKLLYPTTLYGRLPAIAVQGK
jgi:hypothetical protein